MAARPFHVVVCDMGMPGMDATQFFSKVMQLHPQCTRIILCSPEDQPQLFRVFGLAHQYLFKPCDSPVLHDTLAGVFRRGDLPNSGQLKSFISRLRTVPSLPAIYTELVREMNSEEASLQKAGVILARDPGMAAKILQLVNSAFYGLRRRINSPEEAAVYLGIETIKAIVLGLKIFSQFKPEIIQSCNLSHVWDHSWTTGVLARRICQYEDCDMITLDQAFTAALLHDIGKLVLAANHPEIYRAAQLMARRKSVSQLECERAAFGATHATVGGYFLNLWGLQDAIVNAVSLHHCPAWTNQRGFSIVVAVHVANALSLSNGACSPPPECQIDEDYLISLGMKGRLAEWRDICSKAISVKEAA
jgi:HD-like signal output (HDOD) protein